MKRTQNSNRRRCRQIHSVGDWLVIVTTANKVTLKFDWHFLIGKLHCRLKVTQISRGCHRKLCRSIELIESSSMISRFLVEYCYCQESAGLGLSAGTGIPVVQKLPDQCSICRNRKCFMGEIQKYRKYWLQSRFRRNQYYRAWTRPNVCWLGSLWILIGRFLTVKQFTHRIVLWFFRNTFAI